MNFYKLFSFVFSEIAEQLGLEEMCNTLIRDMNEFGVCVLDNFLGHDKGLTVLNEVNNMYSAGVFKVKDFCLKTVLRDLDHFFKKNVFSVIHLFLFIFMMEFHFWLIKTFDSNLLLIVLKF